MANASLRQIPWAGHSCKGVCSRQLAENSNYYVHVYQSNLSLILSKHQDKCWVLVKLNCSLQHHKQQQVLPRLCRELVLSEAPTKLHQNWTIKGYKLVPYTLMRQSGEGRGEGGEEQTAPIRYMYLKYGHHQNFPASQFQITTILSIKFAA